MPPLPEHDDAYADALDVAHEIAEQTTARLEAALADGRAARALACAEILGWLYEYTAALPPEPAQVRAWQARYAELARQVAAVAGADDDALDAWAVLLDLAAVVHMDLSSHVAAQKLADQPPAGLALAA
ncbi:MAG TPA: hypothetical protein VF897_11805 [Roseiflexaceae bacterium]|jgi:hypothetical protein